MFTKHFKTGGNSQGKSLSAPGFLGMEGEGYYYKTPHAFITFLNRITVSDGNHLTTLFTGLKERWVLELSERIQTDKSDNAYKFHNFKRSMGPIGCKVVSDEPLDRLVKDCPNGIVRIDFTFNDLLVLIDQI